MIPDPHMATRAESHSVVQADYCETDGEDQLNKSSPGSLKRSHADSLLPVYGGHGPNRGDPACIELATGEVVWKERAPARGSAAFLYADGHLICRYDRGAVMLIEATPKGLKIKGRFEAPSGEGPAWAHPVVHKGKLYLRHANLLLCYALRVLYAAIPRKSHAVDPDPAALQSRPACRAADSIR